jgi:hypothetical protein
MMALAVQEREGKDREPRLDPVSLLMDVERRLRELASDLQLRRGVRREVRGEDVREIGEAAEALRRVFRAKDSYLDVVNRVAGIQEDAEGLSKKVNDLYWSLSYVSLAVERAKMAAEYCLGTEPSDPFCVEMVKGRAWALETMENVMRAVEKLTGRKCGFAARDPRLRERYDLPSFLNDISNCVHVLAEWLPASGLPTELERRGERCYVERGADGELADLCSLWDRKVRKRWDLYEVEDRRWLIGIVGRGEASFRVGSSYGHAARVRKDGAFVYYDADKPVLTTVYYLMRRLGYSCAATEEEKNFRLTCTPPSPDALKNSRTRSRIADVLSWVTSADIRISRTYKSDCEEYCEGKGKNDRDFEECVEGCLDETYKEEDYLWEAAMVENADVEPGYAAMRDLEEFGIYWHSTRRSRVRPSA